MKNVSTIKNRSFYYHMVGLTVSISLASASKVFATTYDVDSGHSQVGFKVRHLISKTAGSFTEFSGSFDFDPKKVETSHVHFVVQTSSINTNNAKRDEHLKGPDFFNTAQFPSMTFDSTKVTSSGKDKFTVVGTLSLHGVTKPATFTVEYTGTAKDPWGHQRAGFTASTKINRKDFGITWNKSLDAGGLMIGDDVEVSLEIEGVEAEKATSPSKSSHS